MLYWYDAIRCNTMQCALNGFCASTTASSMEDAAPLLLKDCCLQTGVDGSEYMPAKSIPKRSHPWQGWKSLGVQGNRIMINYSPTNHVFVFNVWVRMMKESWIMIPVWFCHSQLLAKSYYLRPASLFEPPPQFNWRLFFPLPVPHQTEFSETDAIAAQENYWYILLCEFWLGDISVQLICHRGPQLLSPGVPVSLVWDCLRNTAVIKGKQRPNPWDSKAEDAVARFCSLLDGSDGWVCLLGPSTILELACGLWACGTKGSFAGPVWRFIPLSTACLGIVGVGLRGWLCRRACLKTRGRLVWTSSWQRPWGEPLVTPLRKLCFRGLKMLSAEPIFLGWAGHTCKIWRGRVRLTASELSLSLLSCCGWC